MNNEQNFEASRRDGREASELSGLVMLLWAIPTWLLTKALTPFLPKEHSWKYRRFSLRDWAYGRTELTEKFDSVGWGLILAHGLIMPLFL